MFSWYAVSQVLNCGGEEGGEKTLECMRSKKYTDILDAMKKSAQTGMDSFGPTADDKVVFRDYEKRLQEGNFIRAPVLIGNTDDERGLSVALSSTSPKGTDGVSGPAKLPGGSPATGFPKNPTDGAETLPKGPQRRQNLNAPPKSPSIECGPHVAAVGRVKNGVPT
jgi:hypothetical protein